MNIESQPAISEINAQRLRIIQESKARAIGAKATEPFLERAPEPLAKEEDAAPAPEVVIDQPEVSEDQ